MKNVTYIISDINKALAFEWIATYMDSSKINLKFVLLNPSQDSDLEKFLRNNNFLVKSILYRGKRDIPFAMMRIIIFLIKYKSDVVHTHLFNASFMGLFAAKLCAVKKRVYTRHHSTFHHQYFPKAVKYDRFCNFLATDIIAITEGVKYLLIHQEHVLEKKITVIHHGFKLNLFEKGSSIESIQQLKSKYNIDSHYPVVGVISRYTEWKGVQYIIPAFKSLLSIYPNAKLILANADGDYKLQIQELLRELAPENYIEIQFEKNIFDLYHLFDVFVHVPIDNHSEAFGQVYVESLAAGVPSVFTLSGIANDFVKHKQNALVVNYKSSPEIFDAIKQVTQTVGLKEKLIENGKRDVRERFTLTEMISKLEKMYLNK